MKPLTPRQAVVLDCWRYGMTDREAARFLGLAHSTVRAHASSILARLGVHTRGAAIAAFYEQREGAA